MKRQILSITAGLVVLIAGAVFAQSSLNTPAPGPSQETKPGQTNNNLQNPGSPQMQQQTDKTVRENGTTEGTAAESNARTQATESTTSAPMDQPSGDQTSTVPPADTTNTTAPPADTTSTTAPPADTTTTAPPADTTTAPPADTTSTAPPATTTTTTTGSYNGSASSSTTDTSTGSTDASTTPSSLPKTASDLPTLALMGLLALTGFFAVRVYAKRNA